MRHYLEFIQEWVGVGFAFPLLCVFTIFGPFALFFLGSSTREVLKNLSIFVAACTFVAYFFLCLGTGIYLGKFHGLGGWGIPLGFFIFVSSVFAYVFVGALTKKALANVRS